MGTTSLTALLFAPMTVLAVTVSDPPVRVRLSDEVYANGERARINVKTAKDGFLVVMRIDTEGHVRVIYPVDPTGDGAVRGGKNIEIRSRGDRDAFIVSEKKGSGLVFSAFADKPFDFSAFTKGAHWNLEALAPPSPEADPEAAMLSIADRMTSAHYDYDAEPYTVGDGYRRLPAYAMYDPFYRPMFRGYSPFYGYFGGWSPFYGPSFGVSTAVVIPIHPFRGRRH